MQTGTAISGIVHLGLIGWVILKGVFTVEPEPVQVTEVALVTAEEYAALLAGEQAPDAVDTLAGLAAPEEPEAPPAPEVADEAAPERVEPQVPEPPEARAAPPEVPEVPEPPTPDIAEQVPEIAPPSQDVAALVPEVAPRPEPRPVERQAVQPAPPPPPDARPDPVTEAPQAPEGREEEAPEAEAAAAPEEATDTAVEPEAQASAAPEVSVRPPSRPDRPARPSTPVETAQPAETPAETPPDRSQAVNDALAAALGEAGAGSPATPSGPPLTGGEQDRLRTAVSQCWSVGALSSAALETTVVVGVTMTPDARPVANSIRLVSWSGGNEPAAQQAFGAARRAIIRCGQQGYPLPAEKYEQWQNIEMTFNPEKMQYR